MDIRRIMTAVLAAAVMLGSAVTAHASDGEETGNGIATGESAPLGEGNTDLTENGEYSLSLEASPDVDECRVGDVFIVAISVKNDGGAPLTGIKIFFEDVEARSAETLAAGEKAEFTIKLKAWPEDIDSGGIINISASANELDEPVSTAVRVKVIPAEPGSGKDDDTSPDTGVCSAAPALAAAALLSAAVCRKRRSSR